MTDDKKEKIEYVQEDGGDKATEQLKKVKKQLKQIEHERKEYLDGWQRERADFANYRRDTERYINESRAAAHADTIQQFLAVLDNMELALKHTPSDIQKADWYRGIEHIHQQFLDILNTMNVHEIETSDKIFNPHLHEAFEQIESDKSPGTILEVIQKGYRLGDKVLRVSKVRVAKNQDE